jgi:hypothetical protein
MKRRIILSVWLMAISTSLAGCGGTDSPEPSDHALDQAAHDRGLILTEMAQPVGIFERRTRDMRERLCVVGNGDDGWRFAAELAREGGGSCLTGGDLTVSEGKGDESDGPHQSWKLRFRGLENCQLEATAQGDALIMPDHMPAACSKLCAGRVSLGGAEMERTSWAEAESLSLRLRGADGSIWTQCGQKKSP